ncbi:MAG: hypothetical protein LKJ37_00955 [Ligilactobacillus acidipiscis]|jgi:hypothetical protein|nr:hypothetical protein [Ligilactobacillus acidipiscis]MCI1953539.1 hypothetical protein [Ligilactobacillus acidipiscis]
MNHITIKKRLKSLQREIGANELFPVQFIQASKKTGEILLLDNRENSLPAGYALFSNRQEFDKWMRNIKSGHDVHIFEDDICGDFMDPNNMLYVGKDDYVNAFSYVNGMFLKPSEEVKQERSKKYEMYNE